MAIEGSTISFDVASVAGSLKLHTLPRDTLFLTITYNYLSGEVPVFVGSSASLLPALDVLSTGEETSEKSMPEQKLPQLPVVADGQFSRSIGFSPGTGIQMNGGLQLNLQGKLSEAVSYTHLTLPTNREV